MGPGIVKAMGIAGIVLTIVGLLLLRRSRPAAAIPGFAGLVLLFIVGSAYLADEYLFPSDFDNPEAMRQLRAAELRSGVADGGADWWQWRGPNRDGTVPGPMRTDWDANPPKVRWQVPCGPGYSSPVVAGGRVYIHEREDEQENVVCINDDGTQRWKYSYPASYEGLRSHTNGPRATPCVFDGRLYSVGVRGQFICLDLDGKLLWQHDLMEEYAAPLPSWGIAGSPLIEGDLAIVQPGGRKGTVTAFDRKSGEIRWTSLSESTGYSSPLAATLAGKRQILAFTGKALHGIDALNGQLLWSYPWTTRFDANVGMPIVAGDHIFISSGYNTGCAAVRVKLNDKGKVSVERVFERRGKLLRTHYSSCVLRDGHIYGFDESRGELKCIDLREPSGEVWASTGLRPGNLTLIGETLLVQTQDGDLVLVEATPVEYRVKGKLPSVLSGSECWAQPAVVGERIYLRDHGKVVCLDVGR